MIQVGRPVAGIQFIGREKEIQEIISYLKMGQSIVLIAPRRFGKTSLVLEVLRRMRKEKHYIGFIDVFEQIDLNQFSKSIVAEVLDNHGLKKTYQSTKGSIMALLKNVKLKASIDDFEILLGMEDPDVKPIDQVGNAIDFINEFGSKANKTITFAMDEYGDILKFDKASAIIKMMRAKIQQQENATYLFSGSYESVMDSLFVDSKSPFYRLAKKIELKYLEFGDVKKYMIKMLKSYEVDYDEKLIEDIIDFLKAHPYYSQLALQQMFLYHTTKSKAPTFQELLELIINSDRSYLEKIWEDISSNKEMAYVLKYLSTHTSGIYTMATKENINASRAIKKLEGKGILYKENGDYHFYDPVFQQWIVDTIK